MPLVKGSSNDAIGKNYKKLRSEGYSEAQSKAIALNQAGRGKSKKGKKK